MSHQDTALKGWVFCLLTALQVYQGYSEPLPASPLQDPGQANNQEFPRIIEGPKDEYFTKNLPATLNCLAAGVPAPTITWYQNGKKLLFDSETSYNDHYRMLLPTGDLFFLRFIHTRNQTHVGTYYCKATNILGSAVSREATVKVAVIKDDFRQQPVDTVQAIHLTSTLHCKPPRGEPDPHIFWQHNEKRVMLGDRITQQADGDLTISSLTANDSGVYVCFAENKAGVRQTSPAVLTVLEVPEITGYPEDVSTDEGSAVEFHCEVRGNADVQWKKDGDITNQQKWQVLLDHTLHIENVEADDEGVYICSAENSAGTVEAVAHLKIEYTPRFLIRPSDQVVAVGCTVSLHCSAVGNPQPTIYWETKAQEELMFVKYKTERFSVSDDGTLRIEHIQKSDQGTYSCIAYSSKGKAQVAANISVRGLKISDSGNYMCKAGSETGETTVTAWLNVEQKGHGMAPLVNLPVDQIEKRLQSIQISLLRGEAVNSTAICISWMVNMVNEVITGFVVQYRHILNMGDRDAHRYGQTVKKRIPRRPLSYTLTGLESYEYYEICVMASSGELTSACSQPMKIQSGEAVPVQPPKDTVIERVSDSELLIKWSPPDKEHRKGEITGYQIKCWSDDGLHNCSQGTNGSTHELKIDGLVPGLNYNIKIAAQTQKGVGKFSSSLSIDADNNLITKKVWFIGMIGVLGCIFWIGLCVFTVWLCKSRKRRKKLKEQWYTREPSQSDKTQRNGSDLKKEHDSKEGYFLESNDAGFPPGYKTILQQTQQEETLSEMAHSISHECSHSEMKTFYLQTGPVTPYATTALLHAQAQAKNAWNQFADQVFCPLSHKVQHSSSLDDSTNEKSATADEKGMLIKQCVKPGHRVGMPENHAAVSWNGALPSPLNHPLCDRGEHFHDDQLYSEIPEDEACTSLSPDILEQLSACSCQVSPYKTQHFCVKDYSDSCNKCKSGPYSLQNLTHIKRQHALVPNMSRNLCSKARKVSQKGGTPVCLHGYSQPWDSQPLPREPYDYDYAQLPKEDGYIYTPPILNGSLEQSVDQEDSSLSCTQPQRDFSDILGGPPGNYTEVLCTSKVNSLNSLKACYKSRGDISQSPYFESHKLESPRSSACEYRLSNSGGSQTGSSSGSVKSKSGKKWRLSSEGNDLKGKQFDIGVETQCSSLIYHSRSENYPEGNFTIDDGCSCNTDIPLSEEADFGESSMNGTDYERDSVVANWKSQEDVSDLHSSSSSVSDGEDNQFVNEEDFASAVAKAAEMSGLTVEGTTISEPSFKQTKKTKRHYRPERPISPGYSTDSNNGTANIPNKPYPKSQRRKQLAEQRQIGDNSNSRVKSADRVESTDKILCMNTTG